MHVTYLHISIIEQLALVALATGTLTAKYQTKPVLTTKYTSSEWVEILKNLEPSISNPNAKPIEQRKCSRRKVPNKIWPPFQ